MTIHYNKLVRDKIPDIIRAEGRSCGTEIMAIHEYKQALLTKVQEEAKEIAEASDSSFVVELADIYEVLDAVLKAFEIDPAQVHQEQLRRRTDRGGFEQRIKLLWTE